MALRKKLWHQIMKYYTSPTTTKLERLGTEYGGYYVPVDRVESDWVCYCAGVGEDIAFDLGLIERFGCHVYAFDPTPRAVQFVKDHAVDVSKYHFYPYGVWAEDTTLRFYAPQDPSHVSHSIVNMQHTDDYFTAECKTLATLMRELNHTHIDLIKLDIEGAEHRVLQTMLQDNIVPRVICVDFDQPLEAFSFNAIRSFYLAVLTTRKLRKHGYHLAHTTTWACAFLHESVV
jgi:FkbM family methyltransferase